MSPPTTCHVEPTDRRPDRSRLDSTSRPWPRAVCAQASSAQRKQASDGPRLAGPEPVLAPQPQRQRPSLESHAQSLSMPTRPSCHVTPESATIALGNRSAIHRGGDHGDEVGKSVRRSSRSPYRRADRRVVGIGADESPGRLGSYPQCAANGNCAVRRPQRLPEPRRHHRARSHYGPFTVAPANGQIHNQIDFGAPPVHQLLHHGHRPEPGLRHGAARPPGTVANLDTGAMMHHFLLGNPGTGKQDADLPGHGPGPARRALLRGRQRAHPHAPAERRSATSRAPTPTGT